jgi:3-deoxy-manno-octulosonate cytidylyltransferase (CMP-KDO synthetase)
MGSPATIGIIPARYASTRFPGKPLANLNGKTVIQRVYEQASKAKLTSVIVATDDKRILKHVRSFGGEAIMTNKRHKNGTERCYEAAKKLKLSHSDVIINIQGDEPFIAPQQINLLANCFRHLPWTPRDPKIATLIKKIKFNDELFTNHVVKVVVDNKQDAIYFSRSPIPHCSWKWEWLKVHTYYKHIGIYGYRLGTLEELVALPVSLLEKTESLEQLRWIENGYTITTRQTKHKNISIDTPDDLTKALV